MLHFESKYDRQLKIDFSFRRSSDVHLVDNEWMVKKTTPLFPTKYAIKFVEIWMYLYMIYYTYIQI